MLYRSSVRLLVSIAILFFTNGSFLEDSHGNEVFYQWVLTNSAGGSTPGPVSGTIGFDTLQLGVGGTHAPSSFTIESAPGHNINNGYVLGDEVVGSGLWEDISQTGTFEFDATNTAISGDFAFREPIQGLLLMDFRSPAQNTFFRSPGPPNNITQGPATWTLVVPEPSGVAIALFALTTFSFVWRLRNIRTVT